MKIQLTVDTSQPLTDREKFILKILTDADEVLEALNKANLQLAEEEERLPETDTEMDPSPAPKKEEIVVLKKRGRYMDKICVDCKKVFTPTSGRAERCPECKKAHSAKLKQEYYDKQRARRRTERESKKTTPVVKTPEKPKTISCKRCHKPYTPATDDKNGYCPKCVDKLRSAPKLKPLNSLFTVREVLAMPVVERYRYAYQWSYRDRQEALSLKPIGALTPEEHEFFNRCQTGDFMDD